MKKVALLLAVLAVSAIMFMSCSKNSPTAPGGLASLGQGFTMQGQGAQGGCIASGQVTISKGMFYHIESLTMSQLQGEAIFEAAHLGHWDIYVELMNAQGQVLYAGMGTAVVKPHKVAEVTIPVTDDLDSVNPKPTPPGQGNPPENNTGTLIVHVEIPETCGLILWSKLGSQSEVLNSEIGPDGQIIGDLDYKLGKYGHGFEPQPRTGDLNIPDNFIKYEGLNLGQQGCIEFWYQPDWINWSVGHVVNLITYGRPADPYAYGITVSYNDWQDRFFLEVLDNGLGSFISKVFRPSTIAGWTTSEPFHFAFTWDGTHPDQTQRARIFINDAEVGSTRIVYGDPTFDNWDADFELYVSSRNQPGDWYRHHWEPDNGVIDNIKIWNYPKTNFSDRFVE